MGRGLLGPAASRESALLDAKLFNDVDPSDLATAANLGSHQDPPIKTAAAGVKALQPVDSGKAGHRVSKGEQLSEHGAPRTRRGRHLYGLR